MVIWHLEVHFFKSDALKRNFLHHKNAELVLNQHPILITSFFIRSSSFAVVKSPFEAVLPTDIVNLFQNKLIFKNMDFIPFHKVEI